MRTAKSVLAALAFGVVSVAYCVAQPVEVALCDLLTSPANFHKQLIRVRAQVSLEYENFSLKTDCGSHHFRRGIWLMYGGDEPTPTPFFGSGQGSGAKLDGKPLLLKRDQAFDLFRNRLFAQRLGRPDGGVCRGRMCYLYDVTATITGTFLAAPEDNPDSGYGHLGCCHLLVIQQVEDVTAKRTSAPAGGRYACSTDRIELGAEEASALEGRGCRGVDDCEVASREANEHYVRLARHFGDGIDITRTIWQSPELMKAYTLEYQYSNPRQRTGIKGAVAIRTLCKAETMPYPSATPITCTKLSYTKPSSRKVAKDRKAGEINDVEASRRSLPLASREGLDAAALDWKLKLSLEIAFTECGRPWTSGGDQHVWCNWTSADGMQRFTVQLKRPRSARRSDERNEGPWMPTWVDGIACAAELH